MIWEYKLIAKLLSEENNDLVVSLSSLAILEMAGGLILSYTNLPR